MSYKDEAKSSHNAKLKGYADGGVVDAKLAAATHTSLGVRSVERTKRG